jgi:hypothetical protein
MKNLKEWASKLLEASLLTSIICYLVVWGGVSVSLLLYNIYLLHS